MSQPPGPPYPYGGQPQQPYGQQPPGVPPQVPYGQPAGYGYQQPYGYPQPGGVPAGMPPLASWGARLGALLLDFLIVNLVPVGLFLGGYLPFSIKVQDAYQKCKDHGIARKNCPNVPDPTGTNVTLMVVGGILMLAALVFLSYREGRTGQTPGRKIVGIRLLREYDGSTTGFGRAFGRRWLHALDSIPCALGYLWPLWDAKNQTWADKMVGTVVVRDQF
ncbi:RDD family protein [Streptomyces sp. NPDC020983]|uniref:RDD family protein n=1 Tax=Streptomyces sp. NPDC020983 TaxID=3365106 RepID=UPI00378F1689